MFGLQSNQKKSKLMEIGRAQDNDARMELDTGLEKMAMEILDELIKANRCAEIMNHLTRSMFLARNTKIRFYKTILRPTALFSCDTWMLNKKIIKVEEKNDQKNSRWKES